MECLRCLLDVGAGKFFRELFHAFARQMVRHVAQLKLNQEIAYLGFLDEILNAPIDGFRTADDDRLRSVEFLPIFHIAQKFSAGRVTLEILSPSRRGNVRNPGSIGELASLAAQVTLEAVL